MADVDYKVINIIRKSIEQLQANNIIIKKAYLFGSFAAGSEDEWSDIDLALVSENFSDDRFNDRLRVMQITSSIDSRIEPAPYKPEQFEDLDPLVWEIKKNGIEISF